MHFIYFSRTFDSDQSSDSSFGFSKMKKKDPESAVDNTASIIANLNNNKTNCAPSILITEPIINDEKTSEKNNELSQRPARQRIPNRRFESYVLQSTQSSSRRGPSHTSLSSVSSLNCSKSPKKMDAQSSILPSKTIHRIRPKSPEKPSKRSKISPQKMIPPRGRFDLASIDDVSLLWPRYNIKSTMFNGTLYTITNTCAMDSVLFVYYFILKTASTLFIDQFNRGSDRIYHIIKKTMGLVDTNGWNVARLYWLTANHRLSDDSNTARSTTEKSYDLFGTVDTNAYQYLRAMQMHVYSTECSSVDCPKQKQTKRNSDIVLR